ncbi:hypothetical protein [Roseococcus pinisoli]|uniref:Lipoprotein SmpA/OmlA domain-containing protein n=1 Tax=Roseococcus pinisoli TaxID=2835040 RepID=A0ABS5QE93_9PROT|nr:hypothetical protein [Roseococcus pinisoli]MBS7811862.1 hypothetical protein [Roseococcus pinisoli]
MRRAHLELAVIALLMLAGCASSAGFDQRMQAYVGRSESDLVASLGVPARTFQTPEGRRFIQYERRRVQASSVGGWGWGRGGGVDVMTLDCNVTFEVTGGRVEGFTSRGNDCVAPSP